MISTSNYPSKTCFIQRIRIPNQIKPLRLCPFARPTGEKNCTWSAQKVRKSGAVDNGNKGVNPNPQGRWYQHGQKGVRIYN